MGTKMAAEGTNEWKHGLFACMDSGTMQLVYMYVFGQCAYGHAMEQIGNGTCLMCCLFGTACACCNRAKVREQYQIKGDCMNDYQQAVRHARRDGGEDRP